MPIFKSIHQLHESIAAKGRVFTRRPVPMRQWLNLRLMSCVDGLTIRKRKRKQEEEWMREREGERDTERVRERQREKASQSVRSALTNSCDLPACPEALWHNRWTATARIRARTSVRKTHTHEREKRKERKERGWKSTGEKEKKSNGMAAGVAGETKDAGRNQQRMKERGRKEKGREKMGAQIDG